MRSLARCAWLTNRVLFGGRARMPGLLVPAKLHARFKHLRFSNRKIRDALGWKPLFGFMEALNRSTVARVPPGETSGDDVISELEVPESKQVT